MDEYLINRIIHLRNKISDLHDNKKYHNDKIKDYSRSLDYHKNEVKNIRNEIIKIGNELDKYKIVMVVENDV